MTNYKYGYADTIQETRHFDIESDAKLTEDEVSEVCEEGIISIYSNSHGFEKPHIRHGEINDKNYAVEYLFSEYGTDTKEEFTWQLSEEEN